MENNFCFESIHFHFHSRMSLAVRDLTRLLGKMGIADLKALRPGVALPPTARYFGQKHFSLKQLSFGWKRLGSAPMGGSLAGHTVQKPRGGGCRGCLQGPFCFILLARPFSPKQVYCCLGANKFDLCCFFLIVYPALHFALDCQKQYAQQRLRQVMVRFSYGSRLDLFRCIKNTECCWVRQ